MKTISKLMFSGALLIVSIAILINGQDLHNVDEGLEESENESCPCPKAAIYYPVCGSNNKTYSNRCLLDCAARNDCELYCDCAGDCPCSQYLYPEECPEKRLQGRVKCYNS